MISTFNIIGIIFVLTEIIVIVATCCYLIKQYKYAIYCYQSNQTNKQSIIIANRNEPIKDLIISNMTQTINIAEINNMINFPILNFCVNGEEIIAIPINHEKTFIGRAKSDDIIINEPTISRCQCVIIKENDKYFINVDKDKNPITFNKEPLFIEEENFKKEILNGDVVSMGSGQISFQFTLPPIFA